MLLLFGILQLLVCIPLHGYLMWQEIKYCGHRDWCCIPALCIVFVLGLIPYTGILICLASCYDYTRDIIEELEDRYREAPRV